MLNLLFFYDRHTAPSESYGPAVRFLLDMYKLSASSVSATGPHSRLLKGQVQSQSVCLCVCLFVSFSVCLSCSVHPSFYPSVCLSMNATMAKAYVLMVWHCINECRAV